MFESYLLVSSLIVVTWIALFVAYLVISRQQRRLSEDIGHLHDQLEAQDEQPVQSNSRSSESNA